MKATDFILPLLVLIAAFLFIAKPVVTWKPFSFHLERFTEAIGWGAMILGFIIYTSQREHRRYIQGMERGGEIHQQALKEYLEQELQKVRSEEHNIPTLPPLTRQQ